MNISEVVRFLLLPLLKNKEVFFIDFVSRGETFDCVLKLAPVDAKKVFASGGRVFRALKNIVWYGMKDASINIVIDIQKG